MPSTNRKPPPPPPPPSSKGGEKPAPWKDSVAKEVLRADIRNGTVTEAMMPKEVWLSRPIFQLYDASNFAGNYRNLQATETLRGDNRRYQEASIRRDIDLFAGKTERSGPVWGKRMQALIEKDIDDDIDTVLQPKEFLRWRTEYAPFGSVYVGKRIAQERKKRKFHNWVEWKNRKKVDVRMKAATVIAASSCLATPSSSIAKATKGAAPMRTDG